eukprot:TRINITY_DN685_c0_g4_i4.p1 TRINITY_DN685_c0_g4~~TRINITY_DN685_c0_g4_i4.p1  ORF type:complete len:388 (+),score=109.63 TRINITY_DN685_c0_g4_i4:55-1218(+)
MEVAQGGVLQIQGGRIFKKWKKKYIEVSPPFLRIYPSEDAKIVKEVIDLRACAYHALTLHADDSESVIFHMNLVDKRLSFRADSVEERDFWINIVRQAIRFSLFPSPSTDPALDPVGQEEDQDEEKGKEEMMGDTPKRNPITVVIKEEGQRDKNLFLMSDDGNIAHVKRFLRREELVILRFCGLYLPDSAVLKDIGIGNGSVLWIEKDENRMFRTSYPPVMIHLCNGSGEVIDFHVFPGENVFHVKQRISKVSGVPLEKMSMLQFGFRVPSDEEEVCAALEGTRVVRHLEHENRIEACSSFPKVLLKPLKFFVSRETHSLQEKHENQSLHHSHCKDESSLEDKMCETCDFHPFQSKGQTHFQCQCPSTPRYLANISHKIEESLIPPS